MQTIDEAIALYYELVDGKWQLKNKHLYEDWRRQVPKGSLWTPGSRGAPDCPECLGMGYQRLIVPLGHPAFGQMYLCSCVKNTA